MRDKIVFTYNPWKYLNSYKNTLYNVRKHYPNSDIFVFFDGSRDDLQEYLEAAAKYNCIVSVRSNELGYINRSNSIEENMPKQLEWIDRIKSACEASESEWAMLLEDDVLIKRAIEHWPTADCGKNMDQIGFLGGGSIFRRKVFLDCLEKSDVPNIIKGSHTASWAGDHLLSHIFRPHGATEEKWIELAEPDYYDRGPHAVFHGYKDLHNT
jgi:hypothetical protein